MKKGQSVQIPSDLTTDPYNKRGEMGKVASIIDECTVSVTFEDGVIGYYDKDCLIVKQNSMKLKADEIAAYIKRNS